VEFVVANFSMGQVYERTKWGELETAKVIAIVDGGSIGWLKTEGGINAPFELLPTRMNGWGPKQATVKVV
jgi:hypothetical protein